MGNRTGQLLGNYRLIRQLGRGGSADVYLGQHIYLKSQVAIKVLNTSLSDDQIVAFLLEAQTLAGLIHPHIIRILDFNVEDGIPFLVMDYASSGSLRKYHPHKSCVSLDVVVTYVKQVALALQYAHDQKLVHRDVKPENMLLGTSNTLLLSDFGIAVVEHTSSLVSNQRLIGTPAYMAPEQVLGKPRRASDQYALGVVVYEWLSGSLPFSGNAIQVATQHLHAPIPSLREKVPTLSPEVEQVVMKALSKNLQQRYPRVLDFAAALEQACQVSSQLPISSPHQSASSSEIVPSPQLDAQQVIPPPQTSFYAKSSPSSGTSASTHREAKPTSPLIQDNDSNPNAIKYSESPEEMLDNNSVVEPIPAAEPNLSFSNASVIPGNADKMAGAVRDKREATGSHAIKVGSSLSTSVSTGDVSPTHNNASGFRQRQSGRRVLVPILVALLLLPLVLCGSLALIAPRTFGAFGNAVSRVLSGAPPSATVTITPKSTDIQNTYVIIGITTGTPDSTKRQVEARVLSSTTQSQTKTVGTTGNVSKTGTHATGILTFINGSLSAYGIAANTVFTDAQGVQITNDVLAYIPAGNPNTGFGRVTVSAHAITVGTRGNIQAGDFSNLTCCGNSSVEVSNSGAFSGGQDAQNYTTVQQGDIDGAANALTGPLTEMALASLNAQVHTGEQFVKKPRCTTSLNSDPLVGDNATSVTVTVAAKCTGEVYSQSGAKTIAANLLKSEAVKSLGPHYALAGNIATPVTQVTVDSKGTVTVFVKAEGIWVFQSSGSLQLHLAYLIAGKEKTRRL